MFLKLLNVIFIILFNIYGLKALGFTVYEI